MGKDDGYSKLDRRVNEQEVIRRNLEVLISLSKIKNDMAVKTKKAIEQKIVDHVAQLKEK